jgi:hypothetical protein
VRVTRIAAHEDPAAKLELARVMGDQATALGQATGLSRGQGGGSGELADALHNSLWGLGVMLLGFEAPQGLAQAEGGETGGDAEPETVDLDFALAGHRELNDAGSPWARSIDPRHFLGDPTHKDFLKGDWCAVEECLSLAEARARWPEYKDRFHGNRNSAPTWDGDKDDETAGQDSKRLIQFVTVYTRRPQEVLIIPDEDAGIDEIIERRPIDLGIEGLPFALVIHEPAKGNPYPIPPLARIYDPAAAENEHLQTVEAAAAKMKTAIIVDEASAPGLADQLEKGSDSGVYKVPNLTKPLSEVVQTIEVGALRKEHLELADRNQVNVERAGGTSDMMLGRREPGDPRVVEVQARQQHISARLAGRIKPAREFEAAVYRGLIAIAYSKLDLLNGLQLALGQGGETRFAVFDANQPMIGELVDYAFEVEVQDKLTTADEVQQGNNVLALLQGVQPYMVAENVQVRLRPIVENILRKSDFENVGEILVDVSPPQPLPPEAGGMPGEPMPPEMIGGQPGAPAEQLQGAPPAPPGPADEMQQLAAVLAQLPEGDPQEEPILRRMAELQKQAA